MQHLTKKHIIIFLCSLVTLLGLLFAAKKIHRANELRQANVEYPMFDGAVALKRYKDQDYYILKKTFEGEHDIQKTWQDDMTGFSCKSVMDYGEYHSFCEKWQLTEKYHDPDMNYIMCTNSCNGVVSVEAVLAAVEYENSDVNLYLWDEFAGATADNVGYVCIIPTDRSVKDINCISLYTEKEYDNIIRYGDKYGRDYIEYD